MALFPFSTMPSETSPVKALNTQLTMSEKVLSTDELLLQVQGYKGELPRQFSAFVMLSLAFSITNSWIGYSAVFITPLFWCGGGPTVIFGLLVAVVAYSLINAGLAELASAYPSKGGQYHFAYMVSSEKYRPVVSFVIGWLSVIAWSYYSLCRHILRPNYRQFGHIFQSKLYCRSMAGISALRSG